MTGNDLQNALERFFETLSEQHVCDDDCRSYGCHDRDDGIEAWIADLDSGDALAGCETTTYERGMYMTRDAGMVVRLADGSEFQITIVQTAHASAGR